MVEEYEEIADPPERTDDLDDDLGKSWDDYDTWKSWNSSPPRMKHYSL